LDEEIGDVEFQPGNEADEKTKTYTFVILGLVPRI
jgi:hypothetical protein